MKSARLRIGFVLCVLLLIVAAFVGLRSNNKRSGKLRRLAALEYQGLYQTWGRRNGGAAIGQRYEEEELDGALYENPRPHV